MGLIKFYEGPSLLDGSPIVGLATTSVSTNVKTGDVIQTYIIRSDIDPHSATKTGDDSSVCGDCPLRPSETGVCYVITVRGPNAVYRAYMNKGAEDLSAIPKEKIKKLFRGRSIRLGSYGDPAAIPLAAWDKLVAYAATWTGYTHQWRQCEQGLSRYCQASCDKPSEVIEANQLGWGTYLVIPKEAKGQRQIGGKNMIVCPYYKIGVQCNRCHLCNGQSKRNIYVHAHGSNANKLKELT